MGRAQPDGLAALLLLSDGRLPAGGYAHSQGLEPAVASGRVRSLDDLEAFLTGRTETAGFVGAVFCAVACEQSHSGTLADSLDELNAELDARIPSPELRKVSRDLGRQLLRAMSGIYPDPRYASLGRQPHQPIVMGVVAAVLELSPHEAALAILHENNAGAAAAAAKLMRVDPFDVHAMLARAVPQLDRLARQAEKYATWAPSQLPAPGAPLADIAAEHHRRANVRLFAS